MTVNSSNRRLVGGVALGLVVVVALELVVVRALLFGLGYRTTARVLGAVTPSLAWVVGDDVAPREVARTVEAVAERMPFATTCLMEALVCKTLLDECGVETDLCVGVTKAEGTLQAHAWLVHRDEILVGATEENPERFHRLTKHFEL